VVMALRMDGQSIHIFISLQPGVDSDFLKHETKQSC
jgi:hypothetical protein